MLERRKAQRRGELPEDGGQDRPAYAQVYLDDGAGIALDDVVDVPERLRHIDLGERATRALGGDPAARATRARLCTCASPSRRSSRSA